MIYEYKCIICNAEFDVVQGVNDTHEAFHCGHKAERVWTLFHTNRDLMYQFNTPVFNNRMTNIYSKRQYNRLLKENGLVDITRKELQTIKPKDNALSSRKATVKKTINRLRNEGLTKHLPSYLKDTYGRKK
jgi:hypothetical protein